MKPSNVAVLALLRAHPEGVTTLQALDAVGCFRLGARIHDLKTQHGFVIDSELVTLISGKRVARYALREKPVQLTTFDSLSSGTATPPRAAAQVAEGSSRPRVPA